MMRGLVFAPVLLLAGPALAAEDAASCSEGIAVLRDAVALEQPEARMAKLRKALRAAEREQKEGEFDECLDAVADGRKALAR